MTKAASKTDRPFKCHDCKSDFATVEEFRNHLETSTHLLENFRSRINREISALEEEIWRREGKQAKEVVDKIG